jgi:hypothetical protein
MEVKIIEMSQGEYQMLGHTSIQAKGVWGEINLKHTQMSNIQLNIAC